MPEVAMPRKSRRAVGVAVVVAALALLSIATPAAAADPDETAEERLVALCADIGMLAEDDPAAALELIEALRAPSAGLSDQAAAGAPELAMLTDACEAERVHAIELQATDSTPAPTGPALWKKDFDTFVATWVSPFAAQALAVAAVWAFLLVLARLFIFVPRLPFRSSRTFGWIVGTIGAVSIASAGLLIVAGLGSLPPLRPNIFLAICDVLRELWPVVLAGLIGSVLVSSAFARRLRMTITVTDAEGSSSVPLTSDLIARLFQLGATKPTGLEVPRGTDVTALSDALATLSAQPFLAAVQSAIKTLFAPTPWRVTVDSADKNRLIIEMSRNGKSVFTDALDPGRFELLKDEPAQHATTLAAATIVTTLARYHGGFDGLAGTTDASSLALHYVATTRGVKQDVSIRLLSQALELDSGNLLATVALESFKHRDHTSSKDIEDFMTTLRGLEKSLRRPWVFSPDYSVLRARVFRAYLAMLRNFLAAKYIEDVAKAATTSRTPRRPRPTDDQLELVGRSVSVLKSIGRRAERLARTMGPVIATDLRVLHTAATREAGRGPKTTVSKKFSKAIAKSEKWYGHAEKSIAPEIAYSYACALVQMGTGSAASDEALEKFEIAFTDTELSDWARQDPELDGIRQLEIFTGLYAPIDPDFWVLAEFVELKKPLSAAGYTNVEQLDGQQDDIDLRRYLGLSKPVFTHVVRVAGLVKKAKAASTAVPAAELAGVTLLQKLLDEGVRISSDVHADWKSESKRVTDLAAELKKRRLDAPAASSIVEWMKAFAK